MLQVSDWGACHSTYDAINAGLDIEMPHAEHFTAEKIKAGLANKTLTMERINESCERILSGWYKLPPSKRYPCGGACLRNTTIRRFGPVSIAMQTKTMIRQDRLGTHSGRIQ